MYHDRLKKILRETKKEMKFLWDRSGEKIQHFSRNKINRFGFPLAYLIFRQLISQIRFNRNNKSWNKNIWFTCPIRYFSTTFSSYLFRNIRPVLFVNTRFDPSDHPFYVVNEFIPIHEGVKTFKKTVEIKNQFWTESISYKLLSFLILYYF